MTTTTTIMLTLKGGVAMPVLGLGVFQSPPEATTAAVKTAITDGYRLIDTAASYDNEREVGEGIRASGINRGDLFITTKLWYSDYGHDQALVGFEGCTTPSRPTSLRRSRRTSRSGGLGRRARHRYPRRA